LCIHGCDGWERVISCTNCVIFFTCFKLVGRKRGANKDAGYGKERIKKKEEEQ
jgi:hypothetical protein